MWTHTCLQVATLQAQKGAVAPPWYSATMNDRIPFAGNAGSCLYRQQALIRLECARDKGEESNPRAAAVHPTPSCYDQVDP